MTDKMQLSSLGIFSDVKIIKPTIHDDNRGFFLESYNEKKFKDLLKIPDNFIQDNHSRSKKGVLRGMHFQTPPNPQSKLVRVVRGGVLDVVIDIRVNSKSFGKWESIELSEKNFLMLYIPVGFAHGFLSIKDNTDVIYKTNNHFDPLTDKTLLWNDPQIEVNWQFKRFGVSNPLISEKDKSAKSLIELKKQNELFTT